MGQYGLQRRFVFFKPLQEFFRIFKSAVRTECAGLGIFEIGKAVCDSEACLFKVGINISYARAVSDVNAPQKFQCLSKKLEQFIGMFKIIFAAGHVAFYSAHEKILIL